MHRSDVPAVEATRHRQCILVLGMHRSGTLALAGVLVKQGAGSPESLMVATDHNATGYFESEAIVQFNNGVLKRLDLSWDSWKPVPAVLEDAEDLLQEAVRLLDREFGGLSVFVLKDPRVCLLARFWQEAITRSGAEVKIVHTHRSPISVAASLTSRDRFSKAYGLLLWLRYTVEAEAGSRGLPRSFTSFDRVLKAWATESDKLCHELGLSLPAETAGEAAQHLDAGLLNFSADMAGEEWLALPERIRTVYAIFEKWAASGEDAADYPVLDSIRAGFDAECALYADMAQDGVYLRRVLVERIAVAADSALRVDEVAQALDRRHQDFSEALRVAERLRSELAVTMAVPERLMTDAAQAQAAASRMMQEQVILKNMVLAQKDLVQAEKDLRRAQTEKVRALGQERDRIRQDYRALQQKLEQMRSSISWRLTLPLRAVRAVMRRKAR